MDEVVLKSPDNVIPSRICHEKWESQNFIKITDSDPAAAGQNNKLIKIDFLEQTH